MAPKSALGLSGQHQGLRVNVARSVDEDSTTSVSLSARSGENAGSLDPVVVTPPPFLSSRKGRTSSRRKKDLTNLHSAEGFEADQSNSVVDSPAPSSPRNHFDDSVSSTASTSTSSGADVSVTHGALGVGPSRQYTEVEAPVVEYPPGIMDRHEVAKREKEFLKQRRANYHIPASHRSFGLALSGGGIRSGAFSLGLLQILSEKNLLQRVDYISCVSGGGFAGVSFLTHLFATNDITRAVTSLSQQMKLKSAFLFPLHAGRWNTMLYFGEVLLRSALAITLGVPLLMYSLSYPLAVSINLMLGDELRTFQATVSTRSLIDFVLHQPFLKYLFWIVFALSVVVVLLECSVRTLSDKKRRLVEVNHELVFTRSLGDLGPWLQRLWCLRNTIMCCLLFLVAIGFSILATALLIFFDTGMYSSLLFDLIIALLFVGSLLSILTAPSWNVSFSIVSRMIVVCVPCLALYRTGRVTKAFVLSDLATTHASLGMDVFSTSFGRWYSWFMILLVVCVFNYPIVVQFMRSYYEATLRDAFFARFPLDEEVAQHGGRTEGPAINSAFAVFEKDGDDRYSAPLVLANTTLNDISLVGAPGRWDFFFISQVAMGSTRTGWVPSHSMPLSRAMVASASAIAVANGSYDSIARPFRHILAFLSIGLGDWISFPGPPPKEVTRERSSSKSGDSSAAPPASEVGQKKRHNKTRKAHEGLSGTNSVSTSSILELSGTTTSASDLAYLTPESSGASTFTDSRPSHPLDSSTTSMSLSTSGGSTSSMAGSEPPSPLTAVPATLRLNAQALREKATKLSSSLRDRLPRNVVDLQGNFVRRLLFLMVILLFCGTFYSPWLPTGGLVFFMVLLCLAMWPLGGFLCRSPLVQQFLLVVGHESFERVPQELYVSDGGHLENTGLYELLARKTEIIFAMDGGDDPNLLCEDLKRVFEEFPARLRATHGIKVDITADDAESQMWTTALSDFTKRRTDRFVRFNLRYTDVLTGTKTSGVLYYMHLKELIGKDWAALASKPNNSPLANSYFFGEFPFHSTALNNISSDLFQKYVDLGRLCADASAQDFLVRENYRKGHKPLERS